ncbi:hypothetical protein RQP46_003711 [Phenoliferia psychrophenolica]
MARASLSTLPLELKAKVVEMVSDQENAWKDRVKDPEARRGHINSLSSLALVNKELRELAAKHQFKRLYANFRTSQPIFRFRILPRYGQHITEVRFPNSPTREELEYVLSITAQLPSLRALLFGQTAATSLFGPGITLSDNPEDEATSYRASMMTHIGHKITVLVLYDSKPSEATGLVRACPNLRTLGLLSMKDPTMESGINNLVKSITSLQHLESLGIRLALSCEQGWPNEALAPLQQNPPPVKYLQLAFPPFTEDTLRLVDVFRSTLETLVLEPWHHEHTWTDVPALPSLNLPLLTSLSLCIQELGHLEHLSRILLSNNSNLYHLTVSLPNSGELDPTEPSLVRVLGSQPNLRRLNLGRPYDYLPLTRPPPTDDLASPSSLAAYSSLVHSSRNLDRAVLDQPYLTPFHPKAKLDYSEGDLHFLGGVLDRTLAFGRMEVKRMVAEGSVKQAVAWVEKLKQVEEARLAWTD